VRSRNLGRSAALALAGVVALLSSGCAGIPTDGPVVAASPIDDEASDVRIDADSPQPGATPTQIVGGFLDAMSRYEFGFPIAREFLTPEARDNWDRSEIEVYNSTSLEQSQQSLVRLFYGQVAHIDPQGHYTGSLDSEPKEYPLRLEQDEDGEWRIATPPPFLLISSLDLSTSYGPYTTYFPDSTGTVLVPDQIWLPTVEPQIASLLAQAVVDGPTSLVDGGVVNAFPGEPGEPDETRVDSAVVSGSVLTVDLVGQALAATDEATRRLMLAQLTATIKSQVSSVQRVDLTIGNETLDLPDISGDLNALGAFSAPAAYLLSKTNAVLADNAVSPAAFAAVPGPLGRGEVPARSLAVALDETVAATVDEAGQAVTRTLLADDAEPERVYVGQDVAPPSFDRYGNLWLVDRIGADGHASAVKIIPRDSVAPVSVAVPPELADQRVTDLRVAPDGVRVAIVTEGAGAVLQLGVITGGTEPVIDLTATVPFDGAVTDVAWASPTDLLLVVTPSDGLLPRPYTVSIDGSATTRGAVSGIAEVAAYATRPPLALTDVSNVLRQTSVLQWEQVATATKSVTYPG
jgi:hypothetical protein